MLNNRLTTQCEGTTKHLQIHTEKKKKKHIEYGWIEHIKNFYHLMWQFLYLYNQSEYTETLRSVSINLPKKKCANRKIEIDWESKREQQYAKMMKNSTTSTIIIIYNCQEFRMEEKIPIVWAAYNDQARNQTKWNC